jgi:hypothetical protein
VFIREREIERYLFTSTLSPVSASKRHFRCSNICLLILLFLHSHFQSDSPTHHHQSNNKTPTRSEARVNAILQSKQFIASSSPDPSYLTSLSATHILKNNNTKNSNGNNKNNSSTTTSRKGKLHGISCHDRLPSAKSARH